MELVFGSVNLHLLFVGVLSVARSRPPVQGVSCAVTPHLDSAPPPSSSSEGGGVQPPYVDVLHTPISLLCLHLEDVLGSMCGLYVDIFLSQLH